MNAPGAIAVVGGTGTLGSLLVAELLGRGTEVRVLSRGTSEAPDRSTHRRVDLTTGKGLEEALDGARVVVDCANASRRAERTLVAGTRRLLEAGAAAGVEHHLAISIVGIDRVPASYYRVKLAQEEAIAAGPLPWSVLRATQFHELVDGALAGAARFGIRLTGGVPLQPIDPTSVAPRLADAALGEPAGRLPDVAGPKVQSLGELSRLWATARGRHRVPLPLPKIGKMGRALAAGGLCDPDAAVAGEDFEEWLRHER